MAGHRWPLALGPDLPFPHSSDARGQPACGSYGREEDAARGGRSTGDSVTASSLRLSRPKERTTREDSRRRAQGQQNGWRK